MQRNVACGVTWKKINYIKNEVYDEEKMGPREYITKFEKKKTWRQKLKVEEKSQGMVRKGKSWIFGKTKMERMRYTLTKILSILIPGE